MYLEYKEDHPSLYYSKFKYTIDDSGNRIISNTNSTMLISYSKEKLLGEYVLNSNEVSKQNVFNITDYSQIILDRRFAEDIFN